VHPAPSRIDDGVREVVALLNRVPGVATRASCEGKGPSAGRHRHADLAYVSFRHPLPLGLQDFLVAHLGQEARVEDDRVYARWPKHNRTFLESLATAARLYLDRQSDAPRDSVRWPLARLRARVARLVTVAQPTQISLCLTCADIATETHPGPHHAFPLLLLGQRLHEQWFADFVSQPENALDPSLVARDGWSDLIDRTEQAAFGTAYRRRWLRYRTRRLSDLTTRGLRAGVDAVRRQGLDLDFFHDGTHAVFTWGRAAPTRG
jgi:hypothetical protein